jgi:heme-degrading monooxygenase HmoA
MKAKRKQVNYTVLTMTKSSDPNDGIRMTDWEFKEYIAAWVQKSLLKEQKKQNEQLIEAPQATNDDESDVASRVHPSDTTS